MALNQQPNQPDYVSILNALQENDESKRKQAEEAYNLLPAGQKFTLLGAAVCQPELVDETKVTAAILLRRLVLTSWADIQAAINPEQLLYYFNQILLLLKNSSGFKKNVRDQISNVVAALAVNSIDEQTGINQWNEFVQFLFESFLSPDITLREISFSIIANSPDVLGPIQDQPPYLEQLFHSLLQNLNEKNKPNQFYVSLTDAVTSLLTTNSSNKDCLKKLSSLTVPLLEILKNINNNEDRETICQQLIEVAEESPTSLRPIVGPLLQVCIELMNINDEEHNVRSAALELCVSLIECAPVMIKKRAVNYIAPIIHKCLALMKEIEDDTDWYTSTTEERDEDDPDALGEVALDRIANALGGKIVLPMVVDELTIMLQKPDWQSRHAALMAFACLGEGCKDQFQGILDKIVTGVLNYLRDQHNRVRYAACHAIGQIANDFGPDFQEKFHAQVLEQLQILLVDYSCFRVQAYSARALVSFLEECPQEILTDYLKPILERIQAVLSKYLADGIPMKDEHKFVVEQFIVVLSSVADTAQENFAPHYSQFIGCLKYIIQSCTNLPDYRLLRGKSIECVSLIGTAVGKEQFMADASDIMQMLLATQSGQVELSADDPQLSFMMEAWVRICGILGSDFQPYLPYVMVPVLKAAAHKAEIKILSEENRDNEQEDGSWQYVDLKDQGSLGIKTSGLEEKATACHMLVCYARELKQSFADWVEKTAEVLIPMLSYALHDDVRVSASECMPHLLESAKAKGELNVLVLWNAIFTGFMAAIQAETDNSVLSGMLENLGSCIENVGKASMTQERLQEVTNMLKTKFQSHFEHLKEKYEDCRDEEYELDSTCSADEEDYLTGISQVMDSLFIVFKSDFLPYFEQLVDSILKLTSNEPHIPWSDRQIALCMWDGLIEHCGPNCITYSQFFLPLLTNGIVDKHEDIRQAALYGIGQLAQQAGPTFIQFFESIIPHIVHMVNQPNSRNDDNISATENGISAIGRILRYCPQIPNRNELLTCWISWLPIWEDEPEVPITMDFLLSLIEQNDPTVMGANSSNLPRLVAIVAETFSRSLIEKSHEVGNKMVIFLKQVHDNPAINSCLNSLTVEQQKAVREVLS